MTNERKCGIIWARRKGDANFTPKAFAAPCKRKKIKEVVYTDNTIDIYIAGDARRRHRIVGRCAQCGELIYYGNGALAVIGGDDILHFDCWEEYSAEHMLDFVEELSQYEE